MSKTNIGYLVTRLTNKMTIYPPNPAYTQDFPDGIAGVCFVFTDKDEAAKHAENGKHKIYAVELKELDTGL